MIPPLQKIILIGLTTLIYFLAFSQEAKKAQEGTYQILQPASKQEIALAEEVLYTIEEKRKDSENVLLYLPVGIEILIFSKDSVESMKLHSIPEEIVPKK